MNTSIIQVDGTKTHVSLTLPTKFSDVTIENWHVSDQVVSQGAFSFTPWSENRIKQYKRQLFKWKYLRWLFHVSKPDDTAIWILNNRIEQLSDTRNAIQFEET